MILKYLNMNARKDASKPSLFVEGNAGLKTLFEKTVGMLSEFYSQKELFFVAEHERISGGEGRVFRSKEFDKGARKYVHKIYKKMPDLEERAMMGDDGVIGYDVRSVSDPEEHGRVIMYPKAQHTCYDRQDGDFAQSLTERTYSAFSLFFVVNNNRGDDIRKAFQERDNFAEMVNEGYLF